MGQQGLNDLPGKANKSYNSWLAWWRSTITADDYFKYLSTQVKYTTGTFQSQKPQFKCVFNTCQDNDYLSLAYHLYESDDSDCEDDGDNDKKPNAKQLELKR